MSSPKPQRGQRYFSESLKRDAVLSYETGRQSVSQISHALKASQTSVYKWIDKYSTLAPKGIQIVERKDSEAHLIAQLKGDLERAHRTIARQTIELDYIQTLHTYIHDVHDIDLKKIDTDYRASLRSASASGVKRNTP